MIINFTSNFQKQFKKLSQKFKIAFKTRLKLFEKDKFCLILNNHFLHGEFKDKKSVNITGDLRAIFEEDNFGNVLFVAIGTHSQLYK
ncbi:hypothetical protein A2335_02380 [Candidatus Peregrinibacteria bacterium RIFOXYB2_FULL_32_7]|nr:MAG: hypothetical protein A2335_02380 [Candidatus Peregrinibacteria bacterium RIFOXYB2_FULL_32_7]